jgi:nitrate/nitrite transporter NarK
LIFELSQAYLDGFPLIIGEVPMLSDWLIGTPLFNQELQPILMVIAIVASFIIINLGKGKIFKFIHGIWKKKPPSETLNVINIIGIDPNQLMQIGL